eukprot:Sspe_Gene.55864::Locus_30729_Transcript_1_1_Confidence_1.000_Length_1231::g.55864::m.55864
MDGGEVEEKREEGRGKGGREGRERETYSRNHTHTPSSSSLFYLPLPTGHNWDIRTSANADDSLSNIVQAAFVVHGVKGGLELRHGKTACRHLLPQLLDVDAPLAGGVLAPRHNSLNGCLHLLVNPSASGLLLLLVLRRTVLVLLGVLLRLAVGLLVLLVMRLLVARCIRGRWHLHPREPRHTHQRLLRAGGLGTRLEVRPRGRVKRAVLVVLLRVDAGEEVVHHQVVVLLELQADRDNADLSLPHTDVTKHTDKPHPLRRRCAAVLLQLPQVLRSKQFHLEGPRPIGDAQLDVLLPLTGPPLKPPKDDNVVQGPAVDLEHLALHVFSVEDLVAREGGDRLLLRDPLLVRRSSLSHRRKPTATAGALPCEVRGLVAVVCHGVW